MTQKELAEKTGITEAAISRYVLGSRMPRASSSIKIANVLRCTVEDLYSIGEGSWKTITKDGFPPKGQPLIVTVKDNLHGLPNQLRYPVYYVEGTMEDQRAWMWTYGDRIYYLLPEEREVVAWQLFPPIYCGEGEE